MRKKGIRVWVSRDDFRGSFYQMFSKKPLRSFDTYPRRGEFLRKFCPNDFERVTGYKLKPGECKRVRINVEEV